MRRIFAALTLLATLTACAGAPGTTTDRIGADWSPGPRVTAVERLSARVDRLSIQSPALGREGSVWVLKAGRRGPRDGRSSASCTAAA
jgi:hypothetical protein